GGNTSSRRAHQGCVAARGSAAVPPRVRPVGERSEMTGRLAKRYARALLALAREQGDIEAVGTEISRAAMAFADPRLNAVLASPMLHASERLRISSQVVAALGLSANVANLLRLLAQRERLELIPDLARVYEELVD